MRLAGHSNWAQASRAFWLSGFAAVIVVGVMLLPSPTHAASHDTALNLTTSPLPISLVAQPGKTVTTQLRIKNSGTKREQLKIGLLKFSAFGEEGKPRLLDREAGDSYFDWVSFSQDQFTAEPNVWKNITMTIKVPPTAAYGYYYAVTFSRASAPKVTGQRQTALAGAIATLVLLEARVPGAKRQVEVVQFKASRKFYEFLPTTFNIKLKNQGNIHVAPSGNIFIGRGKGSDKDIGIIDVNPERGNLLPGSNRIYAVNWTDGFPLHVEKRDGDKLVTNRQGQPATTLTWDFSQAHKLRFGKYTAKLLMVYDDGQRDVPIEGTVSFWVVPWRLIAAALVVVAFVGIGLWSTGRGAAAKLRRRKRKR
ncbi:MAG TPA: hypothetical protein VK963_01295 [Candidatus Saccharimonadales bacterium]|nr:hypothetical protein [Candidatus Saccharimonadales bacterium]